MLLHIENWNKKLPRYIIPYISCFLFFLVWQWDGLLYGLTGGFDMSVLNMESYTGISGQLHYGKDLLFTPYGPLGWLYKGVCIPLIDFRKTAFFQAVVINGLNAGLRTVLIAQFWKGVAAKKRNAFYITVVIVSVFILFFQQWGTTLLDLFMLTCAVFICKIHCRLSRIDDANSNRAYIHAITFFVSVLLAVPQLVKFSYFALAVAFIIILSAILAIRKRYLDIGVLVGGYLAATVGLWILSGEKLRYILSYFSSMLQFVGGYSEVMSLQFDAYEFAFRDFIVAFFLCGIYGCSLLYLFFTDKVQAVSWFIIAPYLFLTFKEAFVRSDLHTIQFIGNIPFAACYLLFVLLCTKPEAVAAKSTFYRYNSLIWSGLLALIVLPKLSGDAWKAKSALYSDFQTFQSREAYAARRESMLAACRATPEYQTLREDIAVYPGKSLGMLSGEQTFFLANDLMNRFKMNPIISLWENFTPSTETAMASQYYSEDAPDVLLYRPESLDDGYFIFRMGTALQSLLENYHVDKVVDYNYLVLCHNDQIRHKTMAISDSLQASIDVPIEIPAAENSFMFMSVDWELTPLGRIASFLLKPPQTKVIIETEDGGTYEYRFFRTLAQNGLYVSSHINDSQEMSELIKGSFGGNTIKSIELQGNPLFYKKNFEISFYAVPFTQQQSEYKSGRSTITVTFDSEIPTGNYQFFYAQNGAFAEDQSQGQSVVVKQNQLRGNIPGEGWNTLRLDFPSQYSEYNISSITCDGKNVSIDGINDAQCVQTESGWRITTGNYDPYIVFHIIE